MPGHQFKMQSLIREIVLSDPFRKRRGVVGAE
jgi:hypothetical protein